MWNGMSNSKTRYIEAIQIFAEQNKNSLRRNRDKRENFYNCFRIFFKVFMKGVVKLKT